MSKVLIIHGITRCADCPFSVYEYRACNHPDSETWRINISIDTEKTLPENCPLPDEKTT